jgi:hypothetical protein
MDHRSSDVGERAPGIRLIRERTRATPRDTVLLGFSASRSPPLWPLAAQVALRTRSNPPFALLAGATSGPSPVAAVCAGGSTTGSFFADAELEPFVAVGGGIGNHLVVAWQQDRWRLGRHRDGALFDRGRSGTRVLQPMSGCGAGPPARRGDYDRASDPLLAAAWLLQTSRDSMALDRNERLESVRPRWRAARG